MWKYACGFPQKTDPGKPNPPPTEKSGGEVAQKQQAGAGGSKGICAISTVIKSDVQKRPYFAFCNSVVQTLVEAQKVRQRAKKRIKREFYGRKQDTSCIKYQYGFLLSNSFVVVVPVC